MTQLNGKRILIIATDGFEQSELESPRDDLTAAGAEVHVASPEGGEIKGWKDGDWGTPVASDKKLSEVDAGDYDALVLPGGQINPDKLRVEPKALSLIKEFFASGKVIAAICHGPWLLVETDLVRGRKVTSYKSIRKDLENAGAQWIDQEVVTDKGLITSRDPDDLPAFNRKIIEEIKEGLHRR